MPEPRENPDLVGHQAAEKVLSDALAGQRMHHAWLMTGPAGIGKATLAYRFARRLLAGPAEGLFLAPEHPVFRRVANGTHADLLSTEREWDDRARRLRTEIPVDAVRTIAEFMHLTPAEGGWRVVIVDGAEFLNRSAANALLKLLEEPPAQAVLLLTSSAPGRLLPTIRSRCRRLRLMPLLEGDLSQVMGTFLPDLPHGERERLIALGEGAPGRVLAMAEEEGVALAGLATEVLHAAPRLPPGRAYEVADKLGRSDQAFGTFMEQLRRELGLAVRQAARAPGIQSEPMQPWLAARPLAEWAEVWHALKLLQDETERFHLDRRHAVVASLALLNGP